MPTPEADWLSADWHAPQAGGLMSTRGGNGVAALRQASGVEPVLLRQVHGVRVVRIGRADIGAAPHEADASITTEPGIGCVVQSADCLPVLLAAPGGVGAAHAGWRGLAGGVVEATVDALCSATRCRPDQLRAWLGACIGPRAFEVGADVLEAFGADPPTADPARFAPHGPDKWIGNLPQLARDRLARAGVPHVSGGLWCTVSEPSRFVSFRRDRATGRMFAMAWLRG